MAQPGRLDFHQDLALARRIEVDVLDLERFTLRVGLRQAHLVEHRGLDLHALPP